MLEIKPLKRLDAMVRIPGSKSYTQRAMVIAALAEEKTFLRDALLSEDTRILAAALGALGAVIRTEGAGMMIRGNGGGSFVPPGRST